MNSTLITAGIACIVGAIVGGGLKAFAIEIPALHSGKRQLALAAFGAILLAAALPLNAWLPPSASGAARAPQPSVIDCDAGWFGRTPPDRIAVIESGAADVQVKSADTSDSGLMVVVIANDGVPVGAVSFALRSNDMFAVRGVVDAMCQPVASFRNETARGDHSVLQNWDTLDVTFGGLTFALRLGYSSGTVTAQLTRLSGGEVTLNRGGSGDTAPPAQQSNGTGVCNRVWFGNAPPGHVTVIETGSVDAAVRSADAASGRPVVLVLTDNGKPVGAVALRYYGRNTLFKIDAVVDPMCRGVDSFRNESRGGDRHVLQNWDTVDLTFGAVTYALRLGYSGGSISGQLTRV